MKLISDLKREAYGLYLQLVAEVLRLENEDSADCTTLNELLERLHKCLERM